MEKAEELPPNQSPNKKYIPEKYVWKRSYTIVLVANALYIVLFYLLMNIFQ